MDEETAAIVGQWMDNRLQKSSISTINTAWNKHWLPFCALHKLEDYVKSGDTERGGIMASFVVHLSRSGMVYDTMVGYVWGVVDKHVSAGYASPLSNVRDWKVFMSSARVECHSPGTSRKMVPWNVFMGVLRHIDMDDIEEVGVGLLLLILFYTSARPELLPKTQTSFEKKNARMCDFRTTNGYLEFCIEGIKQDPLCRRKQARAEKGLSWRPIGAASSPLFDTATWLRMYLELRRKFPGGENDPLFVDKNGNPLTYPKGNAVFQRLQAIIDIIEKYSLGGMRSLSHIALTHLLGKDLAKEHGMWVSDACNQYERDDIQRVLMLPKLMCEYVQGSDMPKGGLLEQLSSKIDPPPVLPAVGRGASSASISASSALSVQPADLILKDWRIKKTLRKNGTYYNEYTTPLAHEQRRTFRSRTSALLYAKNLVGLVATPAKRAARVARTSPDLNLPLTRKPLDLGVCCMGTIACVRGNDKHRTCRVPGEL